MYQGRMGARHCPHCNKKLDGFSTIGDDRGPEPGAISVCLYCGKFAVFTEEGFDKLSDEDFYALPEDVRNQLVQASWAARLTQKAAMPGDFPPAYYAQCEIMYAVGRKFLAEHPCAVITFNPVPREVLILGNLNEAGIAYLACSEDAKAMLRAMDKAVKHEATILQASAVIDTLFKTDAEA